MRAGGKVLPAPWLLSPGWIGGTIGGTMWGVPVKTKAYLCGLAVLLALSWQSARAQSGDSQPSLADVARANQQKKDANAPKSKVYTNEDLATGSSLAAGGDSDEVAVPDKPLPPGKQRDSLGQKLRSEILKEKQQVAGLQQHLDRLRKIESDRANLQTPPTVTPEVCASQPEQCESKRRQALDLARTQQQLTAARHKLEGEQDKARRQGFGPSIWDP